MLKDEVIQRDSDAIRIKKNLDHWQKSNPGKFPEDGFWRDLQVLRGRYTIAILSRFFGIDYHRMQRGFSRGWTLSHESRGFEFAEMKKSGEELNLVPIVSKRDQVKAQRSAPGLSVEIFISPSKIIRIQYETGQGQLLRELLEVLP